MLSLLTQQQGLVSLPQTCQPKGLHGIGSLFFSFYCFVSFLYLLQCNILELLLFIISFVQDFLKQLGTIVLRQKQEKFSLTRCYDYCITMKIQVLFSWRAFTFVFHILGITSDAKALYKTSLLKTGNFPVKLDRFFFSGHKKV